jgi:hypothetical protein
MENCDQTKFLNGSLIYYGFDPISELIADGWYEQPYEGNEADIEEFLLLWQRHEQISVIHCQCRLCQDQGHLIEICADECLELTYSLESINKPADSFEITDIHNWLFPENPLSYDVVRNLLFVGIRGIVETRSGTYAIRSWGYGHHEPKLGERVEDVVWSIYGKTKKPVPYTAIMAELGARGYYLTPMALRRALSANLLIVHVDGDAFVPGVEEDEFANQELIEELLVKFSEDLRESEAL